MTKAGSGTTKRSSRRTRQTVVCFGEVLWDCLPKGLFLGGAPINVAYHLAKQGFDVLPLTAVGRDFLGDEARRRIEGWGLNVASMAIDALHPTGTVIAALDAAGVATYQITQHVAWDHIKVGASLQNLSPAPAAIVFGTLALRGKPNQRALDQLLTAHPDALRVVDLNFRAPFDTSAVMKFALKRAQLVKLNDDELGRLTRHGINSQPALTRSVEQFATEHRLPRVCVTAGERGAGIWWDGNWFWEKARPVKVRDTVGAGDAFLGGLLGALLVRNEPAPRALMQACRLGEFVAGQDGATPEYHLDAQHRPVAGNVT